MKNRFVAKGVCLALATTFAISVLAGCGSENGTAGNSTAPNSTAAQSSTAAEPAEEVTLKMPIYNPTALEIYKKLDLAGEYKKVKPNVTIEYEVLKEKEYENTMRIRNSANELPDILKLQGKWLYDFKDSMADVGDTDAAKNNMFAKDYAIDGKVVGIPETQSSEVIWYRKSVFSELGLTVPKTWSEFINLTKKIKENGKYIPLAMGGKDAWPDYPFNEFMPHLVAQDGKVWNVMATQDDPFSPDKPFAKAYSKIKELYDAKVMGPDPLGVTWDQACTLLFSKKAAMMAAGQWFGSDVNAKADDPADVGAFLLPVRDSESEPYAAVSFVDGFWGVPNSSKFVPEVKEFYNWLFGKEFYTKLMNEQQSGSTMKDVTVALKAPFDTLYSLENIKFIPIKDGTGDFVKIQNAIKFDVKKMGQDMMAGRDLNKMLEKLNKDWKAARANLK